MKLIPQHLRRKAEFESYQIFHKNIRALPKNPDGSFNVFADGFQDNDVDAFRHAFVSGVFVQEYGALAADIFGRLNEYFPGYGTSVPNPGPSMNMDLWNNAVGRSYGKRFKTRKALSRELLKALKNGELITDPGDPREHTGASFLGVAPAGTVVVIQQERRGRNTLFFDFEQRCFLTVAEFLEKIRSGKYPRYTIRFRNGRAFPVARRDFNASNNLG